jgi:MFS family permease
LILGYFSNVFTLNLFYVFKNEPLLAFGIPENELQTSNIYSQTAIHLGILIGILIFGFLADRKGRLLMLFVSIFLYSWSTLLCGVIDDFHQYLFLKFTTGLGIASEFGIGIVIVAEMYRNKNRSFLVAIVAVFGYVAMFLVAYLAKILDWQNLHIIAGFLGLLIMVLRFSTNESDIFTKSKNTQVKEFTIFAYFKKKNLFLSLLILLPDFFMPSSSNFISLSYFKDLKLSYSDSVQYFALGGITCILLSAFFSTKWESRRLVILFNIIFLLITFLFYVFVDMTTNKYLLFSFLFGLFSTYKFELMLLTIESFGTNMRALAATIVYGLGRASIFVFAFFIPKIDFFSTTICIPVWFFYLLFLG